MLENKNYQSLKQQQQQKHKINKMSVSNKPVETKSLTKKLANHNHDHGEHDNQMDDEQQVLSLPKEVMRRVNALKNIQLKMVDVETKFYEELHLLECKYTKMYEGFYEQRDKIVSGSYEPNDEEAKFALDSAEELAEQQKEQEKLDESKKDEKSAEEIAKGLLIINYL